MKAWQIVSVICAAHVASMMGFSAFPALLPELQALWGLTNTEAGWISGIFFAGYVAAVPVLVSLTDRIDARRVYLYGLLLLLIGLLAFATITDGFWSALLWQTVQGAGIGGTYMTGLRMMTDRLPHPAPSRAIAFYTGGFSVGAALSFVFAGEVAALLGWQWVFALAAAGPCVAGILVFTLLDARPPDTSDKPDTHLLDFRPVLRNRVALGYILGYAGHSWELFALRGWIVAFLVFGGASVSGAGILTATIIAGLANVVAVPASIFGNEFAERFGRRRMILTVMLLTVGVALLTGLSPGLPLWAMALLVILYNGFIMGDSASLTAGSAAAALPGYRGATLAVHAVIGFGGAFLGPLAVGLSLDLAGGQASPAAWFAVFAVMGFGSAAGALGLWYFGRTVGRPTGQLDA